MEIDYTIPRETTTTEGTPLPRYEDIKIDWAYVYAPPVPVDYDSIFGI